MCKRVVGGRYRGTSYETCYKGVPRADPYTFLPDKASRKFPSEELWELPFVSVLDWNIATYEGCATCYKKSCGHSSPKRCCYNVEAQVSDHSAFCGDENMDMGS